MGDMIPILNMGRQINKQKNPRCRKRFCDLPETCSRSPAGTACFFLPSFLPFRCADSAALGPDPTVPLQGLKERRDL